MRGASGGLEPPSYRDNPHTIWPLESRCPYIFCRHGALPPIQKPCLPTDFAFRFFSCLKRSAPYPLVHRGRLSATSPAHHRMAINHLLHRLDMLCFLALGATSYLTKYENLHSDTIPETKYLGLCCVRVWLILKESVVAPICPLHWKGSP